MKSVSLPCLDGAWMVPTGWSPRAIMDRRADTRCMTAKALLLIAFAAAFLAIALSGLGRGGRGFRPFLADLRFWVPRRPAPTGGDIADIRPRLIAVPAVEEGGIDDLFNIGYRPEHAYLEPFLRLTQWSAQRSRRADTPLTTAPAADTPLMAAPADTPLTASPAMDTAA